MSRLFVLSFLIAMPTFAMAEEDTRLFICQSETAYINIFPIYSDGQATSPEEIRPTVRLEFRDRNTLLVSENIYAVGSLDQPVIKFTLFKEGDIIVGSLEIQKEENVYRGELTYPFKSEIECSKIQN